MTLDFSEFSATDDVIASFGRTPDQRLKQILVHLTRHIHDFIRETELSQAEWQRGIDFLTAVGQTCTDVRQEFILLSDVLGVSMLVDTINHRQPVDATASTVVGPFHMVDSPQRELGDDIALVGAAPRCVVRGSVCSLDGTGLADAAVDVWQADDEGFYDVQRPDTVPLQHLRGLFRTDSHGRFWFRSILPRHYPIPADGPVGQLLAATKRHPFRPAHIHFVAEAPNYHAVTTHLFLAGSPHLDDDAVFGVKKSLIRPVNRIDDPEQAHYYGVANPFNLIEFSITLSSLNPVDPQSCDV